MRGVAAVISIFGEMGICGEVAIVNSFRLFPTVIKDMGFECNDRLGSTGCELKGYSLVRHVPLSLSTDTWKNTALPT